MFDSAFICFSMPSSWSRNHQALPNCILPGTEPSWKMPMIVVEQLVVARVQVVDDGLRQLSVRVQAIEEARQRLALREVADRVVAGVGPEHAHRARAVVAHGAQVELLHPAARVIHHREVVAAARSATSRSRSGDSALPARALAKIASASRSVYGAA